MSKKRQTRSSGRRRRRKSSSFVIPAIVVVVGLALVVGAILSFTRGDAASRGTSAGTSGQPLDTSSLPFPNVPRISVQETQQRMEQGQAILVDVRSKTSYDKSHAAGSISIPEAEITSRLDELPRDKDIILYCT